MACLPEKILGQDIDNLLAYQTPRFAKIRDRNLGLLHMLLMAAIAGYIIIGQLMWEGQGLVTMKPSGMVNYEVHHPMLANATDTVVCNASMRTDWEVLGMHPLGSPSGDCLPCTPDQVRENWCFSHFPLAQDRSYCTQSSLAALPGQNKKRCGFMSSDMVTTDEYAGVSIASSVRRFGQHKNCALGVAKCDLLWTTDNGILGNGSGAADVDIDLYTLVAEDFMILLEHDFRVSTPSGADTVKAHSSSSKGILETAGGGDCAGGDCAGGDVRRDLDGNDILTLRDVLVAAGAADGLDQVSSALCPVSGDQRTLRESGAIIEMTVDWWNWEPGTGLFTLDPAYKYKANIVSCEYKTDWSRWLDIDKTAREVEQRTAIRIIFVFTGTIRVFEFAAFVTVYAGALALLSVANILVDLLAVKVLPDADIYNAYKSIWTQDFSKLRAQMMAAGEKRKSVDGEVDRRRMAAIAGAIIKERQIIRIKKKDIVEYDQKKEGQEIADDESGDEHGGPNTGQDDALQPPSAAWKGSEPTDAKGGGSDVEAKEQNMLPGNTGDPAS